MAEQPRPAPDRPSPDSGRFHGVDDHTLVDSVQQTSPGHKAIMRNGHLLRRAAAELEARERAVRESRGELAPRRNMGPYGA